MHNLLHHKVMYGALSPAFPIPPGLSHVIGLRQVVARGAADLEAALNFAAAAGAQHLCGILYSALAKYPRPPTAAGRANCARELRQLAARAADKGVKLCLEVVNR